MIYLMDLMGYSMMMMALYPIALIMLLLGLAFFKVKMVRNLLLTLSIFLFSIPFLISIQDYTSEKIGQMTIKGKYEYQDSAYIYILNINNNNKYTISSDNCHDSTISGTWRYFHFEGYPMLKLDNSKYDLKVFLKNGVHDELIFISDIDNNCFQLKKVVFTEK